MIRRGLLLLAVGCAPEGSRGVGGAPGVEEPKEPLTVFAASSLTESLSEVAAAWTAQGGAPVALSFDASSRLAQQIVAGAPADVMISADTQWMDTLAQQSRILTDTRVDLLGNTLVVVVPRGRSPGSGDAAILRQPQFRRIALAGETVPAGAYGDAALRQLGLWDTLSPRIIRGDNVRVVLGWVASGEADAGLVYRTDLLAEPKVELLVALPPDSHPPIVYPAAVVADSDQAESARAFLSWCTGPEATGIFSKAGFSSAGTSLPTGSP